MKHNKLTKISYLVVIAVLVSMVQFSILASATECYSVDSSEDAPPEGGLRLSSQTGSARIASTSENVKTFRTDTAPELDWYQPCNGGDNLIDFYINVHDVDLSTIKSAKLTLAVWDVDYDCGMPGECERDTVYINGHRLTTHEPYLTGANNQWSTCTFNVEPEWIIEGDNYIEIYIDTLNKGWCVECDWGELSVTLENPEIEEIIITPKNPMTKHKVKFEAKINGSLVS